MIRFGLLLLGAVVALLPAFHARAQADLGRPPVPRELLDPVRRLSGDALRICVNAESVLAEFEVDLARAVGSALLVDVTIEEIVGLRAPPILDYRFPMNESELFVVLSNACPIMMGFLLSESRFADWLLISRPYVHMGFVFAVTDESAASSLGQLPADSRIGTRLGSTADLAFTVYNMALPEANRWRRVPYPNNQLLLDRLVEGELDAILIWEPGLSRALEEGLVTGVRALAASPMTLQHQRFGAVFLQEDAFLRTAVDAAIEVLVRDGTIQELLDRHALPGTVPE